MFLQFADSYPSWDARRHPLGSRYTNWLSIHNWAKPPAPSGLCTEPSAQNTSSHTPACLDPLSESSLLKGYCHKGVPPRLCWLELHPPFLMASWLTPCVCLTSPPFPPHQLVGSRKTCSIPHLWNTAHSRKLLSTELMNFFDPHLIPPFPSLLECNRRKT